MTPTPEKPLAPDPEQSPEDAAYAEHLFVATREEVEPVEGEDEAED